MQGTSLLHAVFHLCCIWHAFARAIDRASFNTSPSTTVKFSAVTPNDAKPLLSTLISFSLEQDRWPDWAGLDAPNQFTVNALTNLQDFTGSPPKIRVGANTEDRTVWSPTATVVEAEFPPPNTITPYPEATKMVVGDGFYQLSSHMPRGTHMVWGVNFGMDDPTNAANMAESIMRAFASSEVQTAQVHLDMIEIGNEADLYKNRLRPADWSVEDYTADWINIAGAVVDRIGSDSGVTLVGGSFAGQGFTPTEIFEAGILDSTPGKLIAQISQHRYSGAFCSGGDFQLSSFMNKASIRGNITVFNDDIAEVTSRGLPYVLGETNSIACHGAPGVSNTAGIALWVIDYSLQAATRGVLETLYHQGIGFKYNFFQPVSLDRSIVDGSPINPPQPPHVQPAYYAAILVARAVGSTGMARIVELDVTDNNVSGYAVYENDRLVRAVFVNLRAWLKSSTGTRPSVHLPLGFVTDRHASVRRLTIQHADDTAGLTLGGQSYETADAKVSGQEQVEQILVSHGVDIKATEAVLISFH